MSTSDYLIIRLYGPLASWGEIAVGESRHSSVHPSRSALLGLLGAALGVRRDDDAGQAALWAGYRFGVKLLSAGTPLRDYQTVQAPPQSRKMNYLTRRQELADRDQLGTLLSAREYRCDSLALVAIEALPAAPQGLPALSDALKQPRFPPYLGRRSCPLALPLDPKIVQGKTLREALDSTPQHSLVDLLGGFNPRGWPSAEDKRFFKPTPARYYWEDGMSAGMMPTLQTIRNDQPLSRRRWQFAPRQESVFLAQEGDA